MSLDSIVYAFIAGQPAESIAQSFPVLTLEQVYGAIAFYLGHREEVDRYLEFERQLLCRRLPSPARTTHPRVEDAFANSRRTMRCHPGIRREVRPRPGS